MVRSFVRSAAVRAHAAISCHIPLQNRAAYTWLSKVSPLNFRLWKIEVLEGTESLELCFCAREMPSRTGHVTLLTKHQPHPNKTLVAFCSLFDTIWRMRYAFGEQWAGGRVGWREGG